MGSYGVEVEGLVKKYGKLNAVNHISFKVKKGISFGLLGPNGAGKTTTLKMMCSLIRPDGGKAVVAGFDVQKQAMEVRRRIGYVSENPSFYSRMTTLETLRYICSLLDISPKLREDRIQASLKLVGLEEKRDRYVGEYSRGMRHRLSLAQALLAEPEVLFLDEPTLGLDPVGARDMRDLILKLKQQHNVTIIMSSHTLSEVEKICDEVAVFNHGQVIAQDTVSRLRSHQDNTMTIEVELLAADQQVVENLQNLEGVNRVTADGQRIMIETDRREEMRPLILKTIYEVNPDIVSFGSREMSLEDILFKLLQKDS